MAFPASEYKHTYVVKPQDTKKYTWRIRAPSLIEHMRNANPGQYFSSRLFTLFNLDWTIQFYPLYSSTKKDCAIFLALKSMPYKIKEIHVGVKYYFLEKNITGYVRQMLIKQSKFVDTWPSYYLKNSDIQDLNKFTFTVDITLFAIYDHDDNNVTAEYLKQCNDTFLVKNNNCTYKPPYYVKKYKKTTPPDNNNNNHNNDHNKNDTNKDIQYVKSWLNDQLNLSEYSNKFIENGYDSMVTIVETLNEDDLENIIGIKKQGHRKKIMLFVEKMRSNINNDNKNKSQNDNQEGSYLGHTHYLG